MTEFRADLHCHSTCSDGSATPLELIKLAVDTGLQGLSITDHDTFSAYTEAMPAARDAGLSLLPGAEFSAIHRGASVHILAYAFSLSSDSLLQLCERHLHRRRQRYHKILELLAKKRIKLMEDEPLADLLAEGRGVGRPHIAAAMVRQGFANSIESAFKLYLAEGRSCYVTGEAVSIEETLAAIHAANGLAILAHPHLIPDERLLKELINMTLDGIEGYYARFPADRNQRWLDIAAQKKNWIVTGGSDYHGTMRPQNVLGSSWTPEETFRQLVLHYQQTK